MPSHAFKHLLQRLRHMFHSVTSTKVIRNVWPRQSNIVQMNFCNRTETLIFVRYELLNNILKFNVVIGKVLITTMDLSVQMILYPNRLSRHWKNYN